MVHGTRDDAEALWDEVADVLAPMGLRLSVEKTRVVHIDEGFDFLGWRIQRRRIRGHNGKQAVYTYPSKKSLASVTGKVTSLTRRHKHRTLADLMHAVNACYGDGATTSVMACHRRPSATSTTSRGGVSPDGSANGTPD
jgi:RNA-directed DNA polymerase